MILVIKFFYGLLLPPGIFILFLLFFSLWLFRQKRKRAAILLLFVNFILYALSTSYLGDILVNSLETRYSAPAKIDGDCIVMLGYGATPDVQAVDGKGEISTHGANSLIATYLLYKQTNNPIILSGGQVYFDEANEALIAKRELISMGVPEQKIIVEGQSIDTQTNALYTKRYVDFFHFKKPILVASAYHMERAMISFKKYGMNPQPFPVNYKTRPQLNVYPGKFMPGFNGLYQSSFVIKEYLGILVYSFSS